MNEMLHNDTGIHLSDVLQTPLCPKPTHSSKKIILFNFLNSMLLHILIVELIFTNLKYIEYTQV